MIRHHSLLAALLAAACLPTGLAAQAMIQPLGTTEADTLAQQMRLLASDPRNMTALATAGELSLRLGDLSGAAALFARADKIDPRSGRVKAGMGSILVRSERPGEALRFFQQAESYGWPVTRYAADRGLAFDLVGQQDRAQRDYRLALANGADDETARRYALSLGISGRQVQALEQLDPLIRRQDRAAWRARAFVMAMNGDTSGAARIATTMMPAGMAQGLGAFFQRLPTLPAIDRAFAVHFGEIYPTPQRLADARLTPTYAPLPPEAVAHPPVQVAALVAAPAPDRRSRRERERAERESRRVALAASRARPATRTAPAVVVAASPTVPAAAMRESDVRVGTANAPVAAARPPVPTQPVVVAATAAAVPVAAASTPVQVAPAPVVRPAVPIATASVAPTNRPAPVRPSTPAPVAQPVTVAAAPPVVVAATPVPATASASPPVTPVASEAATDRADSVLARIVASLSIPASELGVVEPTRPDPGPVAMPAAVARAAPSNVGKRVVAEASAKEVRDATLRRTVAAKLTGDPEADEPVAARGAKVLRGATTVAAETGTPATGRRKRGRQTAVEDVEVAAAESATTRTRGRRGATTAAAAGEAPLTPAQRRAADRKAAADKKAAAEKKEFADKAAAEKKAARGNPARIWVQVAGGANEAALGSAWKTMQGRAAALKTRTGYTTPLRATHRVLTGPFKTDAEARAFVNTLRKEGVAAFSFTSDAGQKIEKLSPSTGAK